MSSVKNILEDTVKTSVNNICGNFSSQLSDWLRDEKDVVVSPEEICLAFDVPYKSSSTPGTHASNIQTQLPNYYAGAVTPSKKKTGGRTRKNIDPDAKKCEYVMSRGKTPGKVCEKPVSGDENVIGADRFCKQCLVKAAVQKILEKPDDKQVVQPPSRENDSVFIPEKAKTKDDELQVVEITGKPGWFKEENHGFIVQQTSDNEIIDL